MFDSLNLYCAAKACINIVDILLYRHYVWLSELCYSTSVLFSCVMYIYIRSISFRSYPESVNVHRKSGREENDQLPENNDHKSGNCQY